ncbi:MAG TPA: zinc-dependent metalloprotease [Solirubrobacteraceae bacterium]|jgi:coenzyme F420 biosynthesis associated uncharacterized protein
MDAIDWSLAQRVGELVAGTPPYGGVFADSIQPLAEDFAERVSAYSGLELPTELPNLETVDRPRWIAANLMSMRPLLEPMAQRMDRGLGPLSSAMSAASGFLLGVQVGAIAGMLSQRVLGQYDLSLLDPSVSPRLLLVAPNLAQAAGNLRVDREQLVSWVTIHEITHAVQFAGAPWLREHLGGMLSQLIDSLEVSMSSTDLLKTFRSRDLRGLAERVRRGELLRVSLGEERWVLLERMQATMSLIEGHAEHVMDAVGAGVLPSLGELRAAMNRRRTERGLPWRVLERLLGLELKMRQYELGRRFCDAVVQAGGESGPALLARAWRAPADLPSTAELEDPALWLARVA